MQGSNYVNEQGKELGEAEPGEGMSSGHHLAGHRWQMSPRNEGSAPAAQEQSSKRRLKN